MRLTYRITQFVLFLFRYRSEIIRLQNEIRGLKNEAGLHQNEICESTEDVYSKFNDLEESSLINADGISGLRKTSQSTANQKSYCKNLLAQALIAEVRILRFC